MERPTEIIVAFSGGKDSLAALDVCTQHFPTIKAFFMYWVKGLEFQEVVLQAAERRYGIEIERIPHFNLPWTLGSQMYSHFRASYPDFRVLDMREVQDLMRARFGIQWIASGEKMCDSFTRRFMMRASGAWDFKRLHFYPLMTWTDTQVYKYLRVRHIRVSVHQDVLGRVCRQ